MIKKYKQMPSFLAKIKEREALAAYKKESKMGWKDASELMIKAVGFSFFINQKPQFAGYRHPRHRHLKACSHE